MTDARGKSSSWARRTLAMTDTVPFADLRAASPRLGRQMREREAMSGHERITETGDRDIVGDLRPSAEHPPLALLDSWLKVSETRSATSPRYCHLLITQENQVDPSVWDELYAYVDHAHEGARQALRAPLADSLHPLHCGTQADPAFGYPHMLGDKALQGFFGEIMAGIVAEYYAADGESKWEVPVYLFRTHVVAFQQLELMKQTGNWERQIVGRTGDDGLAFVRDEDGRIIAWLACEAKCTVGHSSALIADNHEKLSQAAARPIDLLRLVDALRDYRDDEYSRSWIDALRRYWWDHGRGKTANRCDVSVYVCGRCPKKRGTWISTDTPHAQYTGRRHLTSAECHLPNVRSVIRMIYGRMNQPA